MANNGKGRTDRTVRELAGEVWSELNYRVTEEEVHWKTVEKVPDIVMGVLARHVGKIIGNDEDTPVERLPEWTFPET